VTPTAVHGPAHQRSLQWDPVYTPEGKVEKVAEFDLDREALKGEIKSRPGPDSHKFVGLSYIDHQAGMIMEHLRKNGLLDHTVVIFMADHNVEPGKATCYEKGNRVPLIVRWPGRPDSHVCGHLVQSVDLVRTIVEAAGVRLTGKEDLDGVNMVSLLNENADPVRESVYMESGYTRAVRAGKYKYIAFRPPETAIEKMKAEETSYAPNHLNVDKQAHSQIAMQFFPHYFDQDQLYDLEEDPYELNNLAYLEEYRDVLEEMKGVLQGYMDRFRHPYDLERIPFMETGTYRQMAENTKDIGTDYIEWFSRDHGGLDYPPAASY
jgi:arylsulfatase A-like enzyme